jgi:hypothetical protein
MAITPNLSIDSGDFEKKIIELQTAASALDAAELGVLNGVTPGTATASKAVVLNSSKGISTITSATITTLTATDVNTTNVTLGTAGKFNIDASVQSLTSHAVTSTKWAMQITTEALTTAAGASQAFVITLTGAAATDMAFLTPCGGTSTGGTPIYSVVMTTNTATVTVTNKHASAALDGTLKFNLLILQV